MPHRPSSLEKANWIQLQQSGSPALSTALALRSQYEWWRGPDAAQLCYASVWSNIASSHSLTPQTWLGKPTVSLRVGDEVWETYSAM